MRKRVPVAYAAAGLAVASVLGVALPAAAQTANPMCASLGNNPVYISGSSASQPVLQALATILGTNVSIIYWKPDSCLGVADMLAGQPSTENGILPAYLMPAGGTTTCMPEQGPDIAVSDVFVKTCEAAGIVTLDPSQKLVEVEGPVQAMTFAVPSTSNATSISAHAAYVVFGYGGNTYQVPQWNDPTGIFVRAYTSGTLNMIGTAIGLSSTKFANSETSLPDGGTTIPQQESSTGNMFSGIANNSSKTNANETIGIISYEAAAQSNATAAKATPPGPTVKVLPYQHTGQSCGYLPDSVSTKADRINVRQGRYDIWGPLHFVVGVDGSGNPVGHSPAAIATLLNYFIGTGPTNMGMTDDTIPVTVTPFANSGTDAGISASDAQTLITAESTVTVGGVVPWCAMQVARTTEVGPEASYQPDSSCGCYFEKTATGAPVSSYCMTCSSAADCTNSSYPKCNFGFCEAQ